MITEEDKDKLIAMLTLQLQDKEKQIKTYAHEIAFLDKKIADIQNSCDYYMERVNDLVLNQNQTAIEQLEKVKEIFGRVKWYQGSCNFGEVKYFDDKLVSWTDVEKEIDNQIKSLKGEEK